MPGPRVARGGDGVRAGAGEDGTDGLGSDHRCAGVRGLREARPRAGGSGKGGVRGGPGGLQASRRVISSRASFA